MIGRGFCWIPLLWGAVFAYAPSALSAQPPADEQEVKATFLYHFGSYVQWPKNAGGKDPEKFYIGVLGKNNVGPFLGTIAASKTVGGKKIVVHHFSSIDEYQPCHVLFIAGAADGDKEDPPEDRLAAAVKKINGAAVLVVGEAEGFAQKGACINFVLEEDHVRMEFNPETAKETGLQISSKLLRLGKIVASIKK